MLALVTVRRVGPSANEHVSLPALRAVGQSWRAFGPIRAAPPHALGSCVHDPSSCPPTRYHEQAIRRHGRPRRYGARLLAFRFPGCARARPRTSAPDRQVYASKLARTCVAAMDQGSSDQISSSFSSLSRPSAKQANLSYSRATRKSLSRDLSQSRDAAFVRVASARRRQCLPSQNVFFSLIGATCIRYIKKMRHQAYVRSRRSRFTMHPIVFVSITSNEGLALDQPRRERLTRRTSLGLSHA